jgi:hypothetical protein
MLFLKRFLVTVVITCICGFAEDLGQKEQQAKEKASAVQKKFLVYSRLFPPDPTLQKECREIQKGFTEIEDEIQHGNLSLILDYIDKLDQKINRAFAARRERRNLAALDCFFMLADAGLLQPLLPPFLFNLDLNSTGPEEGKETAPDPCREAQDKFYEAYRAESVNRFTDAIRLYQGLLDDQCLPEDDRGHAREFIAGRRLYLKGRFEMLAGQDTLGRLDTDLPSIKAELDALAQSDPAWAKPLLETLARAAAQPRINAKNVPAPTQQKPQIETTPSTAKPLPAADVLETGRSRPPLTLDVWQSAWGDFTNIDLLLDYLRKNKIRQVNFNPGLGINAKSWEKDKKRLAKLTRLFFSSGVERVNLLYAELGYPIENYARLLHENPDLRIDTIVDDSEFTDRNRAGFERNQAMVTKWGILYGAFVTLESVGNSGVSDVTRFWALDNVDFPILMSYFSCDLESQKAALKKYLDYADGKGRRGAVAVAILLGSKHVGREVSCEKLLSGEPLRLLLLQLHNWCSEHPSYGGLILETDQRLPRFPVGFEEQEGQ